MDRNKYVLSDVLWVISAVAMAVALSVVFLVVPREAVMGDLQRIFYFHVSSAWVGYLALFVAFVGSLLFLLRQELRWGYHVPYGITGWLNQHPRDAIQRMRSPKQACMNFYDTLTEGRVRPRHHRAKLEQ